MNERDRPDNQATAMEAALQKIDLLDARVRKMQEKAGKFTEKADDAVVAQVLILAKLLNPAAAFVTIEWCDDSWQGYDLTDQEQNPIGTTLGESQATDIDDLLSDAIRSLTAGIWTHQRVTEHTVDLFRDIEDYGTVTFRLD